MPAGRVAGITQGESVRVSDLDAAPEPNANSAEIRFSAAPSASILVGLVWPIG
jgi:hypothetical protein